ncbi:MAG: DNA polymerase III subunit alpha [Pseudomonadota bacterium]
MTSEAANLDAVQAAAAEGPRFIHLRVHSAYSLLEGAIPVKRLAKLAREAGTPAVGVADSGALFGALEFSETMAEAGLQPLIGLQINLDHGPAARPGEKGLPPAPIVLYAQNEAGYRNLADLNSRAYLDAPEGADLSGRAVSVGWEALEARSEGLICLSGGPDGPAGRLLRMRRRDAAEALLARLAQAFPDRLYVEIHRHGADDDGSGGRTEVEAGTEAAFIELADAAGLPLVAVNEVFFPEPDMFEAHDAMLCIADGRYVSEEDRRKLTPEHWFKPVDAMLERFADLPDACEATVEIARRCSWRPTTHAPILPKFADDEVAELRRQAREGLDRRLETLGPEMAAPRADYQERLDYELGVIERMGFPGYFLIVADFIQWAKQQDIPVGPGRGSGAGSLVAYALTITNLDPLRYALLFERFLNPDRVSMPDFDIDFCQDRREEVIKYVQERYGRDRVAQIITFGKLQARAALRDVGRVLQMSFGQVDRLCKLVPNNPAQPVTLEQAIAGEPRLQEARREYVVGQLLDTSLKIEGLYRHASTHAAGVVIGDRPLEQLVPLYRDPRSDMPVTQFNMKWVEPAGLVKFDFLGLKTLTVIQNALEIIEASGGGKVDIEAIPLDDEASYALYSRADTVAVFQVESTGMRDALRQLQPTCIEDIIALVALYRPGPMENIPKYCNVKNGREEADYLHPMLEPILKETQGIIVYQEQVMQIAQVMAGYTLSGADLLRRAMGKKIKAAMDAERPKFLDGAAKNGVGKGKAREVWDLLEKFANYGFNKSHAAAYAYVSYQTAWLKANYPVQFMAAVMNLDMHLTEKLAVYRQELKRLGVELAPPDVNRSEEAFAVEPVSQPAQPDEDDDDAGEDKGPGGAAVKRPLAIRYALGALKNVGREAMRQLVEERRLNGPFQDLFDLARRVDLKLVGKRALENVARAGAFDSLEPNRRRVFESLETLIAYSAMAREEQSSAQVSLFEGAGVETPPPKLAATRDWLQSDRLSEEAAAVGFYISGHPLDDYADALRRKRILTYGEMAARGYSGGRLAAVVSSRQERKSQKGTSFAFVQLSDPSGAYEAVVFSETLHQSRDLLEPGAMVVLAVDAERDGDQLKLRIEGVQPVDAAVASAGASGFRVILSRDADPSAVRSCLEQAGGATPDGSASGGDPGPAPRGRGGVKLMAPLEAHPFEAEMRLPGWYACTPALRSALKGVPGVLAVEEN